jgi:hypothetical protein
MPSGAPGTQTWQKLSIFSIQDKSLDEWRDVYHIVFKFKLCSARGLYTLLLGELRAHNWDLLELAHEHGETFEGLPTFFLATRPEGPDVAALKVLSSRDEFTTFNLDWLTPMFALERNDEALVELAFQIRPTEITAELTAAAAELNNPGILKLLQDFSAA